MPDIEKKVIGWLEDRKEMIFFILISCIGVAIRICGRDFISGDAEVCLLPWYDEIKENGGLHALENQVGNYGVPYQCLIALMTYLPVQALYLYKVFSCIFDFGLAYISAKFITLIQPEDLPRGGVKVYAVVLLCPVVVANSSLWAQCDSIYVFFLLESVYHLYKDKKIRAFLFFGVAAAFKLQAVFMVPFLIFYYVKNKKTSIFSVAGISLIGFSVMQIPGWMMHRSFLEPLQVYQEQADTYKTMWMNFPSFWVLLGDDYEHLKSAAILLTIGILGTGLLAFMESSVCIEDAGSFMQVLIWSVWTCLLFLPAMHERYSYLLMILLILHACLDLRIFCYAVLELLCSTASYGNFLYGNQINLKMLSFVYVLSYFSYTYQILKEHMTFQRFEQPL